MDLTPFLSWLLSGEEQAASPKQAEEPKIVVEAAAEPEGEPDDHTDAPEPDGEDIFIEDSSTLGTIAVQMGRIIARLNADGDYDKFYADIQAWMERNKFFPNVWLNGGADLDSSFVSWQSKKSSMMCSVCKVAPAEKDSVLCGLCKEELEHDLKKEQEKTSSTTTASLDRQKLKNLIWDALIGRLDVSWKSQAHEAEVVGEITDILARLITEVEDNLQVKEATLDEKQAHWNNKTPEHLKEDYATQVKSLSDDNIASMLVDIGLKEAKQPEDSKPQHLMFVQAWVPKHREKAEEMLVKYIVENFHFDWKKHFDDASKSSKAQEQVDEANKQVDKEPLPGKEASLEKVAEIECPWRVVKGENDEELIERVDVEGVQKDDDKAGK